MVAADWVLKLEKMGYDNKALKEQWSGTLLGVRVRDRHGGRFLQECVVEMSPLCLGSVIRLINQHQSAMQSPSICPRSLEKSSMRAMGLISDESVTSYNFPSADARPEAR